MLLKAEWLRADALTPSDNGTRTAWYTRGIPRARAVLPVLWLRAWASKLAMPAAAVRGFHKNKKAVTDGMTAFVLSFIY
ncbi:hypothetical protein B5F53_05410 [Blautia sp. An249]|nr:hypothetical protein B5F53_05410 [Blautia sp. An249]